MIEIKDAVKKGEDFIAELYGKPEKIQLEAFVLSNDKKSWNVSYSFWQKNETSNQLQSALGITGSKVYKTVEINVDSGEVVGMRIGMPSGAAESV